MQSYIILNLLDPYSEVRAVELIYKPPCEYIYCTEMYEHLDERTGGDTVLIQKYFFYKRYTNGTKLCLISVLAVAHVLQSL